MICRFWYVAKKCGFKMPPKNDSLTCIDRCYKNLVYQQKIWLRKFVLAALKIFHLRTSKFRNRQRKKMDSYYKRGSITFDKISS